MRAIFNHFCRKRLYAEILSKYNAINYFNTCIFLLLKTKSTFGALIKYFEVEQLYKSDKKYRKATVINVIEAFHSIYPACKVSNMQLLPYKLCTFVTNINLIYSYDTLHIV